ncbi:hypothetical protein M1112_01530, partial [Candidatus Parvarchaeota archaeon]|nr:hypothetical protein [Candidatus Parvarchaeota archaeon]
AEICDEVAMINHGKLLVYGRISDVVSKFYGKKDNMIEISFLSPLSKSSVNKIKRISGIKKIESLDGVRFTVLVEGGQGKQAQVLSALVKLKLGLTGFKSSSGLEEAYLSVFKEVA